MQRLKDLETGRYCYGDSGQPPGIPCADFDIHKFHRGRCFFKDNIHSCTISMFFSLIIGMSIPEFLEALIFTEKSNTPSKALKRYISTYSHILKWHYGNIWVKHSASQKSVLLVRSMHEKVRNKMDQDRGQKERKFLSQYDMGVVLSGFMGGIIMYPNFFGIACSSDDLDDYVYFWYGVGHLLGIEDEFNICSNGLNQALRFCKDIEQEVVYECLKKPSKEFFQMSGALISGVTIGRSLTLLTYPAISALFVDLLGKRPLCDLTLPNMIRYKILKFVFFLNRHCFVLRWLFNKIIEKIFALNFVYP